MLDISEIVIGFDDHAFDVTGWFSAQNRPSRVGKASGNICLSACVSKFTMAETAEEVPAGIDDEEPEETPGYKAPAQKTLDEIQKLDADDESLVKYKKMLLGGTVSGKLKVIS